MTKQLELLAVVGCVLLASCSAPVPVEDAGQPPVDSGTPSDGGATDAGNEDGGTPNDAGAVDAGEQDGGSDGGDVDAGCVGTAAAKLAFVSAPQTLAARACSAALKVQLQSACGAPVNAAANLPVLFTATSATTEFFGDGACIGKPSSFVIPSGANSLDVYFLDPASGTSTVTATAAGVDAGTQLQTLACPAGEKPCNGNSCIPDASCCTSADCTAPKICNGAGACRVPPCPGFPNGCSTYVDLTASGANRTIAFSSSGYSPDCIRISSSQSVTFSGDFFIHPVEQNCGPTEVTFSGVGSSRTASGFSSFGGYGFRCKSHPTFENGAVKVP